MNIINNLSFHSLYHFISRITPPLILETSTKIVSIIIISVFIIKVASFFTDKFRKFLEKSSINTEERVVLRAKTVSKIIKHFVSTFVSIISVILILGELGINIAPILAGAGVIGLAVSFGAQNLVKDIIAGFFILLEDQYGIGDIIKIETHTGMVESMNLRTTILRDLAGNVHIIPNGSIKDVTIMTKKWSRAIVDIKVSYRQDIQNILNVITEEAAKLAFEWPEKIVENPEILGIDSIDATGITIRVIIKTKPAEQWKVERELRKRVIERFNLLGIELPFFQSLGYVEKD